MMMFGKLISKKKAQKSADARANKEAVEEEVKPKIKIFGTDKLTKLMSKKLKNVASIEYINAKTYMRKNDEGFIVVDDLIDY